MPKRINHIAEKIYDIDNIYYADSQARRGKKNKYWINEHDRHKEEDNLELSNSLKNDTYQISEYKIQKILEATGGKIKERTLKKLPYYPDRIAQWSMMVQLIPIWDKTFIANTYSCIIGRGIHACARDVKKALRKDIEGTKYCFKLDIKKCYDSINHSVLSLLLERKIKDKLVLSWLNKTIQSTDCCKEELTDVISFIKRMSYNSGFTYSSPDYKSSVLVISKTTSGAEFQDTFDHEKGHLAMHITESFDIDPFSEEYQYLVGSIGKKMYPVAKFYLCDNCREDE